MKIAHFALFSPNLAGMYATVRDMIFAERMQGIDAEFIDYDIDKDGRTFSRVGLYENGLVTKSPDWAYKEADIIVRHTLVTEPIAHVGVPMIMTLHGRPEYSYMLEHYNHGSVMKILTNHETDPKYKAYITFWKEHLNCWQILLPKRKIDYIPSIVDLDRFNPDGKKHDFGEANGSPNILIADMWREDITPYNAIMAAVRFQQKYCKTAKIQMFGLPNPGRGFISGFSQRLIDAGMIGEACVLVPFLDKIYRSADILVTPHRIATRIIRESLASGLPIVAGAGCPYTNYTGDARDHDIFASKINKCWQNIQRDPEAAKRDARATAEREFNYENAGKAMLKLCNRILEDDNSDAYLPMEWSGWSLDPTDWVLLRDVLLVNKISKVVEFGAGLSTQLMDRLGVHVFSYETEPAHKARVMRRVKNATIEIWNGLSPLNLKGFGYLLALIDGPVGGKNREPSYKAVVESDIPIVACHDSKRKEDKVWIKKYFSNWNELARNDDSIQGLLILERPDK